VVVAARLVVVPLGPVRDMRSLQKRRLEI